MAELPFNAIEVEVHVRLPPVAVAPGVVVFCEIDVVDAEVQPFTGLVTVRVYVPTVPAVGFCRVEAKLPGPDQL